MHGVLDSALIYKAPNSIPDRIKNGRNTYIRGNYPCVEFRHERKEISKLTSGPTIFGSDMTLVCFTFLNIFNLFLLLPLIEFLMFFSSSILSFGRGASNSCKWRFKPLFCTDVKLTYCSNSAADTCTFARSSNNVAL